MKAELRLVRVFIICALQNRDSAVGGMSADRPSILAKRARRVKKVILSAASAVVLWQGLGEGEQRYPVSIRNTSKSPLRVLGDIFDSPGLG